MTESSVTGAWKMKRGPKMKTGCATCRIRKVKCDEIKPFCQKCIGTGRTCDGYDSRFKSFTSQSIGHVNLSGIKSDIEFRSEKFASTEITLRDIDLLSRCFSIKTVFDVNLDCDEEAKQILQASLTDLPVRYAISSLRALRNDLETFEDHPASTEQLSASHYYGLQQYSIALRGLASKLSAPSSNRLKSALLCCQILISIEQTRKNYSAMVQHIIQGLEIMREYRARPGFVPVNGLLPAHCDRLPSLDVFIIKLFAAPCKFTDPPAINYESGTTLSLCPIQPHKKSIESRYFRTIAADVRTELTRIAASTLQFLDEVSLVQSTGVSLLLLSRKVALLDSLELWLIDLDRFQNDMEHCSSEPVSVSFMRLFFSILKVILLGALDSSPDRRIELQIENDRMLVVANDLTQRLVSYSIHDGGSAGQQKQSGIRSFSQLTSSHRNYPCPE